MTTATFLDMSLIAADVVLRGRVQAAVYQYAIQTINGGGAELTLSNHGQRKNYAAQVLNNPNDFIPDFVWAVAQNQIFADGVVTQNAANFTPTTTAATVAAAVTTATPTTTGGTDTNIANAVANAWNMLANA